MSRWSVDPLLLTGLIVAASTGHLFLSNAGRALFGDPDIWWTPPAHALPLEETADAFRLLIDGRALESHLSAGTLLVSRDGAPPTPVTPDQVRVRLNNWHRVRGRWLAQAAVTGPFFGMTATLLAIGVHRTLARRRARSPGPPDDRSG